MHNQVDADLEPLAAIMAEDAVRRVLAAQEARNAARAAAERRHPFSLARTVGALAADKALHGADLAALTAWSEAAGRPLDLSRVVLPWSVLTRDLNVAAPTAGGNLVGTNAVNPQQALRGWSVAVGAGITVLPRLSGDTSLPVTDGASTITWSASETSAVTPSNPTLRQVLLKPKIAIGVVNFSRTLMLQAAAETFIRAETLAAAGGAVDAAVLAGTGTSGQPTGLLSASGLSTQSGTSLGWSGLLSMKATAAARGARDEELAVVATPAVRQLLEGRERAAGSGFVWSDGRVAGMPGFAATQMTAGSLLVGPWSRVVLGLFGPGIELSINPFDPSGFKAGVIQARVLLALDVGLACDPAAFVKSTSVT